jgi:DNA-binding NarL/FixJ family response regulator
LPADPIKVLLADDHTLFRNGLAGLLASYGGMEVVGSTTNGEEAVALVERTRPDVVLMQVQIPFERAKDILARMRAVSPPPKVVIVTMFESPRYLRELMGLGASAYLIKSASTRHLIGAIRAAVFDPQGENVVVGMPRGMLEEARKGSGSPSADPAGVRPSLRPPTRHRGLATCRRSYWRSSSPSSSSSWWSLWRPTRGRLRP